MALRKLQQKWDEDRYRSPSAVFTRGPMKRPFTRPLPPGVKPMKLPKVSPPGATPGPEEEEESEIISPGANTGSASDLVSEPGDEEPAQVSPGADTDSISELLSSREESGQRSVDYDKLDENIREMKARFPDRYHRWHVPDLEFLDFLMQETDINKSKGYIEKNFQSVSAHDFVKKRLAELLYEYGGTEKLLDPRDNINVYVDALEKLLEDSKMKWEMFDVQIRNLRVLEGSVLTSLIENASYSLLEILQMAQRKVRESNDRLEKVEFENANLRTENLAMKADIERNQIYIRQLKGETIPDELPPEEEFLRELQFELNLHENLNSSLQEKNEQLATTNDQLEMEIFYLTEQNALAHDKKMREVAEVAKQIELNEGIARAIAHRINELTTNPDDVQRGIDEWTKEVMDRVQENSHQLNQVKAMTEQLDDELAVRQVEFEKLKQREMELDRNLELLRAQTQEKEALLQAAEADETSDTFYSTESRFTPRTPQSGSKFMSPTPSSAKRYTPGTRLETIPEDSPDSLEHPRGGCLSHSSRRDASSSPVLIITSPEGESSFSDSGPSPYDLNVPDPLMESYEGRFAPGTQTLSRSPRQFAPEIRLIDPSTQSISESRSGLRNRIDVGDSFHMQTLHSGSPTPYSQVTRVDSAFPEAGSSRMLDSPLNIRHRTEFTPVHQDTPFISHSRYGYTGSPTNILNVPPGDDIIENRGLNKTIVLTSPKRKEPLLVNIDVDPKPLTQTQSGEHFICDISLALQQADDRRKYRHLKPVFTFDEPPAQTPTTARRHGLFTPRGIFKRRHYNVRRVHKPYEYQSPNLPWSPHNLPDAGSPISQLYPSPHLSDSTISWERSAGSPYDSPYMDRTFDSSPPSAINRTFDASVPPDMNRTYEKSPSPLIRGPSYRMHVAPCGSPYSSPSPTIRELSYDPFALNRSYEKSQSPVIRGPSSRMKLARSGRAYDRSPSPMIRGPSSRMKLARSGRAYDRSPSPMIKGPSYGRQLSGSSRTFDSSPSPAIKGPFYGMQSPRSDRTFDSSPPPAIKGPSYGMQSPRSDRTFDSSPSPVVRGPSYGMQSPRSDRTFSSSPSPAIKGPFYGMQSPRSDRTFDSSPSPLIQGRSYGMQSPAYYNSQSPASGYVADSEASPSPAIEEPSYARGMREPAFNRTFDKSSSGSQSPYNLYSPRYNSSRDSSRSSHLSQSPSPSLNRTYDTSLSPLDTAFLGEHEQQ